MLGLDLEAVQFLAKFWGCRWTNDPVIAYLTFGCDRGALGQTDSYRRMCIVRPTPTRPGERKHMRFQEYIKEGVSIRRTPSRSSFDTPPPPTAATQDDGGERSLSPMLNPAETPDSMPYWTFRPIGGYMPPSPYPGAVSKGSFRALWE